MATATEQLLMVIEAQKRTEAIQQVTDEVSRARDAVVAEQAQMTAAAEEHTRAVRDIATEAQHTTDRVREAASEAAAAHQRVGEAARRAGETEAAYSARVRKEFAERLKALQAVAHAIDFQSPRTIQAYQAEAESMQEWARAATLTEQEHLRLNSVLVQQERRLETVRKRVEGAAQAATVAAGQFVAGMNTAGEAVQGLAAAGGQLAWTFGIEGPWVAAALAAVAVVGMAWDAQARKREAEVRESQRVVDEVKRMDLARVEETLANQKRVKADTEVLLEQLYKQRDAYQQMGAAGGGALGDINDQIAKQVKLLEDARRAIPQLEGELQQRQESQARQDQAQELDHRRAEARADILRLTTEIDGAMAAGNFRLATALEAQLTAARGALAEARQQTLAAADTNRELVHALELEDRAFTLAQRRLETERAIARVREHENQLNADALALQERVGPMAGVAVERQIQVNSAADREAKRRRLSDEDAARQAALREQGTGFAHDLFHQPEDPASAQRYANAAAFDNSASQRARRAAGAAGDFLTEVGGYGDPLKEYEDRRNAIEQDLTATESAEVRKRRLYAETWRTTRDGLAAIAQATTDSHSKQVRAVGHAAEAIRRIQIGAEAADAAVKSAKAFAEVPLHLSHGDFGGAALAAAAGTQLAAAAALGFKESLGGGGGGAGSGGGGGGAPTFEPKDQSTAGGNFTLNLITRDPYGREAISQTIFELQRAGDLKRTVPIAPTTGLLPPGSY